MLSQNIIEILEDYVAHTTSFPSEELQKFLLREGHDKCSFDLVFVSNLDEESVIPVEVTINGTEREQADEIFYALDDFLDCFDEDELVTSKGMEFGDLEDLHESLCWLFKCFKDSFSIDWTMTGGEYSHGIAYAVMCDDWWFGAANPRP